QSGADASLRFGAVSARAERPAFLRRARCGLFPGIASRSTRSWRAAGQPPLLEVAYRGDRPRPDLLPGAAVLPFLVGEIVASKGRTAAPVSPPRNGCLC